MSRAGGRGWRGREPGQQVLAEEVCAGERPVAGMAWLLGGQPRRFGQAAGRRGMHNNSQERTRLAPEETGVPCPASCARMDEAMPEPPGPLSSRPFGGRAEKGARDELVAEIVRR